MTAFTDLSHATLTHLDTWEDSLYEALTVGTHQAQLRLKQKPGPRAKVRARRRA